MKQYVIDPLGRLFRQPAFVICVLILLIGALTLKAAARKFQWHFRKEPVHLRKSFAELDVTKLAPYEMIKAYTISKEIEEELGTSQYIQWDMLDTTVESNDPFHYLNLFITYYTGDPDSVPHVPDVCATGGGAALLSAKNYEISVPANGTSDDTVPVRMLQLEHRGDLMMGGRVVPVTYFFSVNGSYACQRHVVRVRQNRLTDRYTYFSKVEINFPLAGKETPEDVLAAVEKFARILVPVLADEHWPDWQALKDGSASQTDTDVSTK